MLYTYDATGNPTSILDARGMGRDLEWNADNQLRSIVDTEKGYQLIEIIKDNMRV